MSAADASLPEGTVTVLSTDLVGSTALNQRLGDEAAVALEREIEGFALAQVAKQRGIVVKDTGDGLMVAFQSARRAVACAQEIQRALARRNRMAGGIPVQLRMGLHTGEVISEDGVLHGETMILAKRVEESALPGSIFASDTVYGVLGTARGELEDRGDFDLKGIANAWHLYEVPWQDAQSTGVLAGNERTPFVGRAPERARLLQATRRAREGSGSLLFIAGEVGVGKTRFTEELVDEARKLGLQIRIGQCIDQQGAPPYLPWVEMLEEAARSAGAEALRDVLGENAPELAKLMPALRVRYPDIPEPVVLPPEQERRFLFQAVSEFLQRAAVRAPHLLVFEDLHWADEPTLLLLRHVAKRLAEMPVLLIGTYRHTELKPGLPLAELLPELLSQRLGEELLLSRFDEAGVRSLLQGRAGREPPPELVRLVFSETEGNPFFVEEVFRHLIEAGKLLDETGEWRSGIHIADTEVPRGVGLVIGQRLDRVSAGCRKMLTLAALAGRVFRFDLLAACDGVDEDELLDAMEEAIDATLVEDISIEREARYRFVHEQIRQTLLSLLSFARRQRLHLRVADALETLHGPEAGQIASEIAHHLYQAGAAAPAERTARWLVLASRCAADALAFEDALRNLEAASNVLPASDSAGAVEILCQRARALRGLARIDEALATLGEAIEAAADDTEREPAQQQRAQLLLDLFRGGEAMADLEPLLARARAAGDRAREAELLLLKSRGLYIRSLDEPGIVDEMRASHEEAYAIAKEVGDKRAMARALIPTNWFVDYWYDYRERALANNDEALALARELGDADLEIDAQTARLRLMHPVDVEAEAARLRRVLEERRDPLRLKEHYFWLMWHALRKGDLAGCVAICDAGIELAHQLGSPPVQYPSIKALALIDLGRPDDAWQSLQEEVADAGHPFGRCMQQLGETVWLESLGALDRAVVSAKEVLEEAGRLSRTWMQSAMLELMLTVALRKGAAGGELRAWVETRNEELGYKFTPLARGTIAEARGDYAEALALADRAAASGYEIGHLRGRVSALEASLRALAGQGRWDELCERADLALEEARTQGFDNRAWRILQLRARAHAARGDSAAAAGDRAAAREITRKISTRISEPELRECFEQAVAEGENA